MFDRRVAHHEAGHAVAMLQYTRGFYSAHVLPRGQTTMVDCKGREVACSGLVQGSAFNWDVSGYTRRKLEANGIAGLAASAHAYIDLAGPFAEARYRRASQAAILLTAGTGDWESHAVPLARRSASGRKRSGIPRAARCMQDGINAADAETDDSDDAKDQQARA